MRRRLSVLGTTMLPVAPIMVASAPPLFAQDQDGGCQNGQDQAFLSALTKTDNDEQEVDHLKMVDCTVGQPPGEGQ